MSDPPWIIEPFEGHRHDRTGFDCGNLVLNEWLATRSGQYARKDLARTYVLVGSGDTLVRGYYAISSHSVVYQSLPEDQARGLPQFDVPVMLIGRLAVDRSVQGQKLGEFLLLDALRRSEYLAERIGIRAVEVHAIDGGAARFYGKYGFRPLLDDPNHLNLPMQVIRKLKLPPL